LLTRVADAREDLAVGLGQAGVEGAGHDLHVRMLLVKYWSNTGPTEMESAVNLFEGAALNPAFLFDQVFDQYLTSIQPGL
jgi:hypothetical protein